MKALKPDLNQIAAIRGGGDLATGIIQKLWRAGFAVVVLEAPNPLAVRRTVSLCTAVTEGRSTVEDMVCVRVQEAEECYAVWERGEIPLIVDPMAESIETLHPTYLIDATVAKRNLGTHRDMAPITIGLGPGFSAPEDVDVVIETMRGHNLGRMITDGSALPNTGVPGIIGGKGAERVLFAPHEGVVKNLRQIGDRVAAGEPIFSIGPTTVYSPLTGTLRGLIADGTFMPKGFKCGDVDPRPAADVDWNSISDKARALGGAVLEACLYTARRKELPPLCPKPDRSAIHDHWGLGEYRGGYIH